MATHYQSCKEIFKERVLPHFPHARERFRKHFRESYDIIKGLEVSTSVRMDSAWRPGPTSNEWGLDLTLALTVLGAKPLATSIKEKDISRFGAARLRDAGLEIYKGKNNSDAFFDSKGNMIIQMQRVWLYDPVLLAPMLSEAFNSNVSPEKVRKTLKKHEREAGSSHTLLGFIDKGRFRNGRLVGSRYGFEVVNYGTIPVPDGRTMPAFKYYSEGIGCTVYSLTKPREKLEGWALAGAMVEEIRESAPDVVSHAGILEDRSKPRTTSSDTIVIDFDEPSEKKIVAEAMVIRQKWDWLVLRYSTLCEEFGRKSA